MPPYSVQPAEYSNVYLPYDELDHTVMILIVRNDQLRVMFKSPESERMVSALPLICPHTTTQGVASASLPSLIKPSCQSFLLVNSRATQRSLNSATELGPATLARVCAKTRATDPKVALAIRRKRARARRPL
mmetsp:Transcript_3104/g.9654  ORF Transcript_3104/g.9654 Transcript_3104/m.9654 type:complete len:132 (+) Transcript_3104:814-1209(+)